MNQSTAQNPVTEPSTQEPSTQIIVDWWKDLKASPGKRASLRRAKTLDEVIMQPAYHTLRHKLATIGWTNSNGVALLAGVLAWTESDLRNHTFGQQLHEELSELRFRRLIQIQDRHALYPAMLRVIRHLGKNANLKDLIPTLYFWGPANRKRLTFAYFDALENTE